MIYGCDISHHQKPTSFNYNGCGDFAVVKATEGGTYQDECMHVHLDNLEERGKAVGLYHYARAERNAADIEAKNFIKSVKSSRVSYPMLALDVEGECWKNPAIDNWCVSFVKYVEDALGVTPLIYVSAAYASKLVQCAEYGCGLWLAWYNNKPEIVSGKYKIPWAHVAMHQYTSNPYDKDVFFGNLTAFKMYGGLKPKDLDTIYADDTVEDASRVAQILNELEKIVNKYKGL